MWTSEWGEENLQMHTYVFHLSDLSAGAEQGCMKTNELSIYFFITVRTQIETIKLSQSIF